ncbi:Glycosyltransferase 25 family member [Hypsibius exemplaris]|uniref:Glycosyltransferase 25 family member n=1 Tax=Hypsibius exemplaris TaxID=2072580 RepID=A0A1W0X7M6_HYPEX|nr:Glycosyltransferase 25 family member [Hypsibius exemplaris]
MEQFYLKCLFPSILFLIAFPPLTPAAQTATPTVLVAIIARNAEITLPFVLGGLEQQDYPADKLHIWIRTDCNADNTTSLLLKWTSMVRKTYAKVDFYESECWRPNEKNLFHADDERRQHVQSRRDDALDYGRTAGLDFVLFLDSNAFLVEPSTITDLVASKRLIIAPFLPSLNKYGNFWCNVTEQNRYIWSQDCSHVFEFESIGLFDVALVHSAVLIDIKFPETARIRFASDLTVPSRRHQKLLLETSRAGLKMTLTNVKQYGYCLPSLPAGSVFQNQADAVRNLQLEILVGGGELPRSRHIPLEHEDLDTLDFDHIYLINLDRRPERRVRLEKSFSVLGLEVERIQAVDGRNLDLDFLKGMGVKMLDGYSDPYRHRPMTMGEYGCFLSHYAIWRDVVDKGYEKVLIFEDDIRFEHFFRQRMATIWRDIARLNLDWDLIYLGRKRLVDESEPFVRKSRALVHVGYSYWTLSYMLSNAGAQKLLKGEPLMKMIPVDEYLPVMFNRHPNDTWNAAFPERDVVAFSVYPLLVYPSHYTGDVGYISDTEQSEVPLMDAESSIAPGGDRSKDSVHDEL